MFFAPWNANIILPYSNAWTVANFIGFLPFNFGIRSKSVRKILLSSQRLQFYQHSLTCPGEFAVKEETSVKQNMTSSPHNRRLLTERLYPIRKHNQTMQQRLHLVRRRLDMQLDTMFSVSSQQWNASVNHDSSCHWKQDNIGDDRRQLFSVAYVSLRCCVVCWRVERPRKWQRSRMAAHFTYIQLRGLQATVCSLLSQTTTTSIIVETSNIQKTCRLDMRSKLFHSFKTSLQIYLFCWIYQWFTSASSGSLLRWWIMSMSYELMMD